MVNLLVSREIACATKYWTLWESGEWKHLPDEIRSYGQRNLAEHLEHSSMLELLHQLISYDWMQERVDDSKEYTGFLEDVDRAWKAAYQEVNLPYQIKYAFCTNCISALSTNIPPNLFARALEQNVFTPQKCLNWIQNLSDDQRKAEALSAIASLLPELYMKDALAIAFSLKKFHRHHLVDVERPMSTALENLAPYISDNIFKELCSELDKSDWYNNVRLEVLLPYLPQYLIDTICIKLDVKRTVKLLELLVPFISSDTALHVYKKLDLEDPRDIQAYACLLAALPENIQMETVETVVQLIAPNFAHYLNIVARIAPYLPQETVAEIVDQTIPKLTKNRIETNQDFLPQIYPYLSQKQLVRIKQVVLVLCEYDFVAKLLVRLIPYLPSHHQIDILHEIFSQLLSAKQTIEWSRAMHDVLPLIPYHLRANTISLFRKRKFRKTADDSYFISFLAEHYMPEFTREIMAYIQKIWYPQDRVKACFFTLRFLPQRDQQKMAVSLEKWIKLIVFSPNEKISLYIRLLSYLPYSKRCRAVSQIMQWIDKYDDISISNIETYNGPFTVGPYHLSIDLVRLSKFMAVEDRHSALKRATKIFQRARFQRYHTYDSFWFESGISEAASYIPDDVLALITSTKVKNCKDVGLNEFAKYMPEVYFNTVWGEAQKIVNERTMDKLFDRLQLEHTPASGSSNRTCREEVDVISEEEFKKRIGEAFVKDMERHVMGEDPYCMAYAIVDMAPRLSQPLILQAYQEASALEDDWQHKMRAIAGLISYLPDALLPETILMTAESDSSLKSSVFGDGSIRLMEWATRQPKKAYLTFNDLLNALAIRNRKYFLESVTELLSFIIFLAELHQQNRSETILSIYQEINEVSTWWPQAGT